MSIHNNLYVRNDLVVDGTVETNDIDSKDVTTLSIGSLIATKLEISSTTVTTEIKGNLDVLEEINASSYLQLSDISAPANPSAGEGRLYKKTGNDGVFWKPDTGGVEVDLTTAPQYIRTAVTDTESPYTILSTDEIIGVDTTSGAVTVTLPQISTIGGTSNYRKYHIVDEGGNCVLNNITVATSGGNTINKETSPLLITVNHTSISLYNDGTSNWIII